MLPERFIFISPNSTSLILISFVIDSIEKFLLISSLTKETSIKDFPSIISLLFSEKKLFRLRSNIFKLKNSLSILE